MKVKRWMASQDGWPEKKISQVEVVNAHDYDRAVGIIRMIADMPASTHEIDRQLCKEWLADNG